MPNLHSSLPFIFVFPLAVMLGACTATYAPQTNAPVRPLLDSEVEIEAGYSGLAHINSNDPLNTVRFRSGVAGGVRLGVSDHLMLGVSGWIDEFSMNPYSGGAALEGIYTFHDTTSSLRLGAHFRYAQLYAGNEVLGHGTQWGPVLWLPTLFDIIAPVIATEGGYFVRFNHSESGESDGIKDGFLWTQAVGLGVELPLHLQLTGELTSTFYSVRRLNAATTREAWWTLTPSLSIGWRHSF